MITLILSVIFLALNPVESYNQGNAAYEQKDYNQAIARYEESRLQADDPRLWYNLGNAYFKTNKIGQAILCYRRARCLAPRDPDIAFNLNFARHFRVDKIPAAENPFYQILRRGLMYFSPVETSFLAAMGFLMGAILLSLYIIQRRRGWLWLAMAAGLLWLFFLVAGFTWRSETNPDNAVIIVSEANALSGPGPDYAGIMILHDGTEAWIRESRGDYYLIQIPGGLGGWVKQETVKRIFSNPR